ncbi:YcxB family protein [Bradyrhizobium iriomotense]|uniref:YcxB-like C-terminal domain-containing protein n=1 Tax=Bradyrhizobium iriomotense TaxID=441950 RepID=A0ABQ6B8Z2_9BRAD|nr:YcxB family protein [Bradyrhizobium iriomotense]GLR89941.1 hypothetical protein GCM10007857_66550 [Bradyrhizobium iriomotense]
MSPLKYHRDLAHWTEFVRLAQARVYGKWMRLALLAAGALPMLLGIIASALWPGSVDTTSVLFGVLSTLVVIGALSRFGLRRHVKDAGWVLGNREITVTEQGFVDAGNGTVLSVDWPAIEGVSVARNIIVLWMDRAAGVFIPRIAFESDDDERSFVEFAGKRSGAA